MDLYRKEKYDIQITFDDSNMFYKSKIEIILNNFGYEKTFTEHFFWTCTSEEKMMHNRALMTQANSTMSKIGKLFSNFELVFTYETTFNKEIFLWILYIQREKMMRLWPLATCKLFVSKNDTFESNLC